MESRSTFHLPMNDSAIVHAALSLSSAVYLSARQLPLPLRLADCPTDVACAEGGTGGEAGAVRLPVGGRLQRLESPRVQCTLSSRPPVYKRWRSRCQLIRPNARRWFRGSGPLQCSVTTQPLCLGGGGGGGGEGGRARGQRDREDEAGGWR